MTTTNSCHFTHQDQCVQKSDWGEPRAIQIFLRHLDSDLDCELPLTMPVQGFTTKHWKSLPAHRLLIPSPYQPITKSQLAYGIPTAIVYNSFLKWAKSCNRANIKYFVLRGPSQGGKKKSTTQICYSLFQSLKSFFPESAPSN